MQKLKTRVIKKDVNPEWNEDLTLSVTDPSIPIKLVSGDMFQLEECNPSFNLEGISLLMVNLFVCGVVW